MQRTLGKDAIWVKFRDFGHKTTFLDQLRTISVKNTKINEKLVFVVPKNTFHEKFAKFGKKSSLGGENLKVRLQGLRSAVKELGPLGPVFGPHVPLCGGRIRVPRAPALSLRSYDPAVER